MVGTIVLSCSSSSIVIRYSEVETSDLNLIHNADKALLNGQS